MKKEKYDYVGKWITQERVSPLTKKVQKRKFRIKVTPKGKLIKEIKWAKK